MLLFGKFNNLERFYGVIFLDIKIHDVEKNVHIKEVRILVAKHFLITFNGIFNLALVVPRAFEIFFFHVDGLGLKNSNTKIIKQTGTSFWAGLESFAHLKVEIR